jgi:hypothetical protein
LVGYYQCNGNATLPSLLCLSHGSLSTDIATTGMYI